MSEITIPHVEPAYQFEAYPHVVEPLSEDDGGGFLISFPDLPGCMSDGESIEAATANGRDAFSAWMSVRAHMGKPIPKPTRHGESAEPVRMILETSVDRSSTLESPHVRYVQSLR